MNLGRDGLNGYCVKINPFLVKDSIYGMKRNAWTKESVHMTQRKKEKNWTIF